jgi:undecaprenyl diphosphate synthase
LTADTKNTAGLMPDRSRLPRHVAIIMDGNGRWAAARRLPRIAGHKKGADAVRACVQACGELGIQYLTLYAFSSENWKRPLEEVDDLMGLLRHYLKSEISALNANNVRLRCIGRRDRLSPDIVELMEHAERTTAANTGLTLILALNYGGRAEIVEAARALVAAAARGEVDPAAVDEDMVAAHLHTADIPDPDIIIRTSGEQRLSNFLLWQGAYAELVFINELWPDFSKDTLLKALAEFDTRERRYGARLG